MTNNEMKIQVLTEMALFVADFAQKFNVLQALDGDNTTSGAFDLQDQVTSISAKMGALDLAVSRAISVVPESMGKAGVYLRKKDGDLIKLRQQIAIAQRFRKAGTSELKPHALGMKEIFPTYKLRSHQLAHMLCKLGVECNKDDIDNGRRKARNQGSFIPHQVPRNDQTALILRKLKTEVFPDLEIDQFLTKN